VPSTSDLEGALVASGFDTQKGSFEFLDMSQCCSMTSCFGNNPSSPYAAIKLGRGAGQTAANIGEDSDQKSVSWRLRGDEAVVLVGKTPPKAAYFGYTLYLFDRAAGAKRELLFASLGDTINNLSIATDDAKSSFERTTALIITANATSEKKAREALVASGLAASAINTMPIPTPLAHVGLEDGADTFNIELRVALVDDAAKRDAYLASPGATVFRVTPKTPTADAPYETPTLRKHGTGTNEASLQASLDKLHAAILAKHAGHTVNEINVAVKTPFEVDQFGPYCIEKNVNCNGDNHDTLYPLTDPFYLPSGDEQFAIVWGVNHEASGKTSYSSFTLYDLTKAMGVVSVDSRKLAGSAADYIPNDPNVSKLYAYKVARSCKGAAHCVEVPTACPGVALDKVTAIAFRTYLEPSTKTSPDPKELLLDHVTRFLP